MPKHPTSCDHHTYNFVVALCLDPIMAGPNSYFVPGFGISRAVIQNEIHYYCGPDAIVRPYTHQVRN